MAESQRGRWLDEVPLGRADWVAINAASVVLAPQRRWMVSSSPITTGAWNITKALIT